MKKKKSSHFYSFSLHPYPYPQILTTVSDQIFKFFACFPVIFCFFFFFLLQFASVVLIFSQNSAQHFFNAFSSRKMAHCFQFGTLKTLVFSSKKLSFFLSYKSKTLTLNSIETQTLPRASSARQRAYLQEVWVRVPPRPN